MTTVKFNRDCIRQERVEEVVVKDYQDFTKALNALQAQFELAFRNNLELVMEIWLPRAKADDPRYIPIQGGG